MAERLTDDEIVEVRRRWEHEERRLFTLQSRALESGEIGPGERITRPPGHDDIPRLLATLEAERARAAALEGERDRLKQLGISLCAEVEQVLLEGDGATEGTPDEENNTWLSMEVTRATWDSLREALASWQALLSWRALTRGEATGE